MRKERFRDFIFLISAINVECVLWGICCWLDTPVVVYVYDNVHAVAEFCIIIKCCPTLKPCYATIDGKYKKRTDTWRKIWPYMQISGGPTNSALLKALFCELLIWIACVYTLYCSNAFSVRFQTSLLRNFLNSTPFVHTALLV